VVSVEEKVWSDGGADVRRLRELEKENSRPKRIVAERDLEIDALQEVLKTNFSQV
jgi:hypothetical protein